MIDKEMSETIPNTDWLKFKNKIIMGDFSDPIMEYLKNNQMEAYEKIDGTNSKIAYYPSKGICKVGGKTDKAESQSGQFEFLTEIAERILPQLKEMFPKECAKFKPIKDIDTNKFKFYAPILDETNRFKGWYDVNEVALLDGIYGINVEEVPIYIYGEYYGKGITKVGKRYSNENDFIVFDINQQGWWLPCDLRNEICNKLGLQQVPSLGTMTINEAEKVVSEGFKTHLNAVDPTLLAEGIVLRCGFDLKTHSDKRVIVKIKHVDYKAYNDVRKQFTNEEFEKFNKWYNSYSEK